MRIKKITFQNFRNYADLCVEIPENVKKIVLIGDNAQGKTNFLEALSILSFSKSFRSVHEESMVQNDKPFLRINAELEKQNELMELEYFFGKGGTEFQSVPKKQLQKNQVKQSIKDFIGLLNIVVFHSEDLNLVMLSPKIRRQYFDRLLCQIDNKYLKALMSYNKAHKHRNKLLHAIREAHFKNNSTVPLIDELEVWDEKLIEEGSYIFYKRNELIHLYNELLTEEYLKLSHSEKEAQIKYEPSILNEGLLSQDDWKTQFRKEKAKILEKDKQYAKTHKGPHRDDYGFLLSKKNIHEYASRGEMRTMIIALKITEMKIIEKIKNEKPILLLDDIFSELDDKRQQYVFENISDAQTFLTTTSIHHLKNQNFLDDTLIYTVESGILNSRHLDSIKKSISTKTVQKDDILAT